MLKVAYDSLRDPKPWILASSSGAGLAFVTFIRNDSVQVVIFSLIGAGLLWLGKAIVEALWKYFKSKIDAFFTEFESIGNSMNRMTVEIGELRKTNSNLAEQLRTASEHHQQYEEKIEHRMQRFEDRLDTAEITVAKIEARGE